jgi:hypothetical protein
MVKSCGIMMSDNVVSYVVIHGLSQGLNNVGA